MKSSNVPATVEQLDDAIAYLFECQQAATRAIVDAVNVALADLAAQTKSEMQRVADYSAEVMRIAKERTHTDDTLARMVASLSLGAPVIVNNLPPQRPVTRELVRDEAGRVTGMVEVPQ